MQQKLFTGSSPNLPPLPNCLHSGNLQKGVKAITEIPSLFLLPFSSSAYISFRNRSKGLEHAIFWAPKHITFSPPEVARNLVLLKNSSRQNYNFYHIFSTIFAFSRMTRRKGFPSGLPGDCILQSVETQRRCLLKTFGAEKT